MSSFNPRPRAGGDVDLVPTRLGHVVSIHAPARGATANLLNPLLGYLFQSTPPRGGRQEQRGMHPQRPKFQSTPPRGGRQEQRGMHPQRPKFQSTPPRGGRRKQRRGPAG